MKIIRYFTKHSPRSIRTPHWATLGWLEEETGRSECGKRQNQRGQRKETEDCILWGPLVLVLK